MPIIYIARRATAGIRWEQELAILFHRSGWTQQELAKKEGKGQNTICRYLLFGPIGIKLSEAAFAPIGTAPRSWGMSGEHYAFETN